MALLHPSQLPCQALAEASDDAEAFIAAERDHLSASFTFEDGMSGWGIHRRGIRPSRPPMVIPTTAPPTFEAAEEYRTSILSKECAVQSNQKEGQLDC